MLNLAALREYACVQSLATQIPASTLLTHNDQCIAIFDAYPKAKYHFLVLPRFPFRSDSDSKDSGRCRLDDLNDLTSILRCSVRKGVIEAMANLAKEVEEMIQDEMMKTDGFVWGVNIGFHAIPSMRHVHLHVISDDRISPSLKTKKHYNSFRPDLGFLISLEEVERWLKEDEGYIKAQVAGLAKKHDLLNEPLACDKCGEVFGQMPKLKLHLEEEWAKAKKTPLARQ